MSARSKELAPFAAPRTEGPALGELDSLYAENSDFVQRAVANLAGPGLDPEDLVQDVFVHAIRGWSGFARHSSVRTWLYGVALGVVRNARRRSRFRQFFGLDEATAPASPESSAAERLESEQARAQVHTLLDKLPEKKRTVLILFELEGLSGETIAEILGCPLPTVWSRLRHARHEFAAHLERAELAELDRTRSRS